MTQTEKDSNTLQDMFKPRRNPERINWDRSRDLAGEQSILWACAGCTGRPSYWGSDEETVWQSCQRCGHEKVTRLDTLMQDLTALKNDRCPKCYARDKHPQSLVWRLERCAKCVRWPFKRELGKPQFDSRLADWKCRREYVWERDRYTCQYCGKVTNSPHCDHVIPQSKGGDKSPENLVTACPHCNCSKCDHTPEEWQRRAS